MYLDNFQQKWNTMSFESTTLCSSPQDPFETKALPYTKISVEQVPLIYWQLYDITCYCRML